MVYRIDDTTAVSSPPPIPSDNIGQPGFFTGGSTSGQSATRVRFWWLNMIQEELVAFASAAGLALDKSNNAQTLAAARILFAAAERGVAPYSAPLAQLIGGYPKYAIVVDATGVLWRSTADANMTVPGADDATWVALFDGLATQEWADIRYIKTAESDTDSFVTDITVNKKTGLPFIQSEVYSGPLQPYLGFTPVRQGGGAGQGTNKVALGWATDGSGLKCQIDGVDQGYLSFRGDQYFVPFSGSTSNSSSAAASISFTPARSGRVKIDFNVGQSSSNNISSININTSGLNSLGGGGNHSATNLYVSSLLYEVSASTQAVFTVEGIFAGVATATSVGGVATFIPYNN